MSTGKDVALIECSSRSASAGWAYLASTAEALGAKVETWWYHEYLNRPTTGTAGQEAWDRYGRRVDLNAMNGVYDDNFHYTFGHRYWPVMGDRAPSGADATITFVSPMAESTFTTSLFGCHGTSGSGVFGRGSTAMYGPVTNGGSALNSQLCGETVIGLKRQFTAEVYNLSYVANDRAGIY